MPYEPSRLVVLEVLSLPRVQECPRCHGGGYIHENRNYWGGSDFETISCPRIECVGGWVPVVA